MVDARIQIVNEALAMIGAEDIEGWDEETTRNRAIVLTYNRVKNACIGHPYRWRFAQQTFLLDAHGSSPINGWKYGYHRPGTAIGRAVRILTDPQQPHRPLRKFAEEAAGLYADETPLWGTFVCDVDPNAWPPTFRNLVVHALAASFAIPESHDTKLMESMHVMTWGRPEEAMRGGIAHVAINDDVSGAPVAATPVSPDPFTFDRAPSW